MSVRIYQAMATFVTTGGAAITPHVTFASVSNGMTPTEYLNYLVTILTPIPHPPEVVAFGVPVDAALVGVNIVELSPAIDIPGHP